MTTKSITLFLTVFITACASSTVALNDAQPATRILGATYMEPDSSRTVPVVVIHDDLMGPSVLKTTIAIDGHPVAQLSHGEKVSFYVSPGPHSIGWYALGKSTMQSAEFTIGPSLRNVFHLRSPGAGAVQLQREYQ